MFLEILRRVQDLARLLDRRQRAQPVERGGNVREAVAVRAFVLDEGHDLLENREIVVPAFQHVLDVACRRQGTGLAARAVPVGRIDARYGKSAFSEDDRGERAGRSAGKGR